MSGDWFGCVLVILFDVSKVLAETVAWSPTGFANLCACYAIDEIKCAEVHAKGSVFLRVT